MEQAEWMQSGEAFTASKKLREVGAELVAADQLLEAAKSRGDEATAAELQTRISLLRTQHSTWNEVVGRQDAQISAKKAEFEVRLAALRNDQTTV